jgi:FkbM family methyltransferase
MPNILLLDNKFIVWIRISFLKILKKFAFDTTIKHHLTRSNFLLNTYTHKGYWFYGKKREENTIRLFREWISSKDYVLEIGGHIGYFTIFFISLVGKDGKVDVFEPSEENLKYLEPNISRSIAGLNPQISVIRKGAGDINGKLDFYLDPITGQNNSFVENFEGFFTNREYSPESSAQPIKVIVEVTTLDSYFEGKTEFPSFVKIDVEGFEWNVIQGFKKTIEKSRPSLMIEIQKDSELLINYFKGIDYSIFNDEKVEIITHEEYLQKCSPNIFFRPNSINLGNHIK